ncbi:LamG-like jellyroll fold domain-containing protein [Corallococcus sp. CA054B]|uniref:LamG-like jellyroll fold domain-containing protein n=1 Tax=Corallococcus sp. CA054B TaxID=2316734 RepID=UPI0013152C60
MHPQAVLERQLVLRDVTGVAVTNGAGTGASPTSLNDGGWHHVAYTRSGTSLKMYVDGVLVGSGTSAAPRRRLSRGAFVHRRA